MGYEFGIRVDMGGKIGAGHFYRCFAVAEELYKKGKNIVFLVKSKKNLLAHLPYKVPYIVLKGKTEIENINHCLILIKNINVLIFDLPFQNELYSKKFAKNKTVIIDDLGNKKVYSQLLFNGSIVKNFHKYTLENKLSKIFLGPKYMIIRKSFWKARTKTKISKTQIKKILLTFGGSDEKNLTKTILLHLLRKKFQLSVVLGPTYPQNRKLAFLSKKYSNLEIKSDVEDMTDLMQSQDLVISSPGITTYELACLGIPCIMIPFNMLQYSVAAEMENKGFGVNYGYWDNNFHRLDLTISNLNDYKIRKRMHCAGKKIVDGKGLFRISKNLLSLLKE